MIEQNNNKVILFVLDDDAESNEQLKWLFDREGITDYTFFIDPEEFLKAFTSDVSIAIIDHFLMNDLNGLEVMKRILEINNKCYIIMMSGQMSLDVIVDAFNIGAKKYVDKNRKGFYQTLIEFTKVAIHQRKQELELIQSVQPAANE